jgi:hypothetical protein
LKSKQEMEGNKMKSDRTEALLPAMERSLAAGAAALGRRQKAGPIRRLSSVRAVRLVAAGIACLAFGGTAMAATGVWNPVIGSAEIEGPVTTSETPVPQEIVEALGVLRRAPSDRDHSPEVEATLREVAFADGVRPDSVRFLKAGDRGEATIVLSAENAIDLEVQTAAADPQPVCVFRPGLYGYGHADDAPSACFGIEELLAGRGYAESLDFEADTGLAFGLVPDGVVTVTAEFANAPAVTVPVTDNYFEIPMRGPEVGEYVEGVEPGPAWGAISKVTWQDADGAPVPQQPDLEHGEQGAPLMVEARLPRAASGWPRRRSTRAR